MRIAPAVSLTEEDHAWLLKTCNSTLSSKRLSERCAVVLLAAKVKRNDQIARQLKITRQKAARWRQRLAGLAALRVGVVWAGNSHLGFPEFAAVDEPRRRVHDRGRRR